MSMRQSRIIFLLSVLVFLPFVITDCAEEDDSEHDKTLREIVEENYSDGMVLIGGTAGSWAFGTELGLLLDREFGYITPENDYKHSVIRSDHGSWSWDQADAWQQHIIDNSQILRIHGPIGPQCSTWAKDDTRTAVELQDEIVLFMKTLCQRYNGKQGYEYIDVVNETVVSGSWHEDKTGITLWECPWFKIGQYGDANATPMYIALAFQTAMDYAPDLKFIYNHHESADYTASWDLIKSTVLALRSNGLRVDGIGWQAHIDAGSELLGNALQNLRDLITWAHNNNLEFHITEASVWMKEGYTDAQLELQADTYRAVLRTLLENRSEGVVGWNTWHVSDVYGWHTEWYPSLFDSNYRPKPAYQAVREELLQHGDD